MESAYIKNNENTINNNIEGNESKNAGETDSESDSETDSESDSETDSESENYVVSNKPFLRFYQCNNNCPLILRTSIFPDINEFHNRNVIIEPDVCKCIIGLCLVNYNLDIKNFNIEQIHKIISNLQFIKDKSISKNGFIHDFGICDTYKNEWLLHLFEQDIPEPYFDVSKNLSNNSSVSYHMTQYEGDNYVVPIIDTKHNTIRITMETITKMYTHNLIKLLDCFTLSKKVCGVVPNP